MPVAEGTAEPLKDLDHARREAQRIGYPVMLKAAGGGGGKGLRAVASVAELDAAWRLASGEASGAFGNSAMFVEKLIEHARHVEMQILADGHGGIVWLGERDCSIQRRHQKLIEESPAPSVDDALRERLGEAAVRIARAAGYQNAGTVEFLVDARGAFSFLEVNTRLQVEHPVTEMVTGLDLVALQLRIAAGEPLPFAQGDVRRRGAAIELRVTAEDAQHGFLPATGRIALLRQPCGPGVRVDSGLFEGLTVTSDYDPLLMKVITHGADRAEALARARRAVRETIVAGLPTSLRVPCARPRRARLRRGPLRHRLRRDALATACAARARGQRGHGRRTGRGARFARPREAPTGRRARCGMGARGPRGRAAVIYEVTVGERRLRVEVGTDGRFLVDEAVVAAEAAEIVRGRQWSVRIAGRSHEVTVLTNDPLRLLVDGREIDGECDRRTRGGRGARRGRRAGRAPRAARADARPAEDGPRRGGRRGRVGRAAHDARGDEDGERAPRAGARPRRPARRRRRDEGRGRRHARRARRGGVRKLVIAAVVLLVIFGAISTTFGLLVLRPLPSVEGDTRLLGLHERVEVLRDGYGVPHIFASDMHDALFVQGYVTAQDRLWQMDIYRRAAQGRLAEVLGEPALESDRFMRTIGLGRAAQLDLGVISDEARGFLEAYMEGVNKFLQQNGESLPVEFTILGYRPEPWTLLDTLAVSKLQLYDAAGNYTQELLRASIAARLGPEVLATLLPDAATNAVADDARAWALVAPEISPGLAGDGPVGARERARRRGTGPRLELLGA